MKKYFFFAAALLMALSVRAQQEDVYSDAANFTNWRNNMFEAMPIDSDDIVFVGNSITNNHEWREAFGGNPNIKGRGIGGITTDEVMAEIDNYASGHPAKLFLMIGTNDLNSGGKRDPKRVNDYIRAIVERIRLQSPATEVYLQSILPVGPSQVNSRYPQFIYETNELMKAMAETMEKVTYVDLWSLFIDENRHFAKPELLGEDHLHLSCTGYALWCKTIAPLVGATCVYPEVINETKGWGGSGFANHDARHAMFTNLPVTSKDVLMFGGGEIMNCLWNELLRCDNVKNRASNLDFGGVNISGAGKFAEAALADNDQHEDPAAVFFQVGQSDVWNTTTALETVLQRYKDLVAKVHTLAPTSHFYIMSLAPYADAEQNTTRVVPFNQMLEEYAKTLDYVTYIDLYDCLYDGVTKMSRQDLCNNHLFFARGYAKMAEIMAPYIGKDVKPVTMEEVIANEEKAWARRPLSSMISQVLKYQAGTETGRYPADLVTKARSLVQQAVDALNTDEDGEYESLLERLDATLQSLREGIVPPTDGEDSWYKIVTPFRDRRQLISQGAGNAVGSAMGERPEACWRFEQRADGMYNIINYVDGSYIALNSSNNIVTSAEEPEMGWELKQAATPGYFVFANGEAQFNQANSAPFNLLNWGGGNNTTDAGCQFAIVSVDAASIEATTFHAASVEYAPATELVPGEVYAFQNIGRNWYGYVGAGMAVMGTTDLVADDNAYFWKLEGDATQGYTFQNVLTGTYIPDMGQLRGQNVPMNVFPGRFSIASTGEGTWNIGCMSNPARDWDGNASSMTAWDSNPTTNGNNAYRFYRVIPEGAKLCDVYYDVYIDDDYVTTMESQAELGSSYTFVAPTYPYLVLDSLNSPIAGTTDVITGETVVELYYKTSGLPFKPTVNTDLPKKYAMSIFNTSAAKPQYLWADGDGLGIDTSFEMNINDDNYLWYFVGNPIEGFKIYNVGKGEDVALGGTPAAGGDINFVDKDEAQTWTLTKKANGDFWYVNEYGMNQWGGLNNTSAKYTNNSNWAQSSTFTQVVDDPFIVTYNLYYLNDLIGSPVTEQVEPGDEYIIHIPTLDYAEGEVVTPGYANGDTVMITGDLMLKVAYQPAHLPFQITNDPDDPIKYTMTINNTAVSVPEYLYANGNEAGINITGDFNKSNAAYYWYFTGDPFFGFKIHNMAKGKDYALGCQSPELGTAIEFVENAEAADWILTRLNNADFWFTNGFGMNQWGGNTATTAKYNDHSAHNSWSQSSVFNEADAMAEAEGLLDLANYVGIGYTLEQLVDLQAAVDDSDVDAAKAAMKALANEPRVAFEPAKYTYNVVNNNSKIGHFVANPADPEHLWARFRLETQTFDPADAYNCWYLAPQDDDLYFMFNVGNERTVYSETPETGKDNWLMSDTVLHRMCIYPAFDEGMYYFYDEQAPGEKTFLHGNTGYTYGPTNWNTQAADSKFYLIRQSLVTDETKAALDALINGSGWSVINMDDLSDEGAVYDLFGRRLPDGKPLSKGVYIVNGRKQLVK